MAEAERAKVIEKWDQHVERETRVSQWDIAFFEGKLQGYLSRLEAAGRLRGRKSYRLPSALLQWHHVSERWMPRDREALEAWAREHGYIQEVIEVDLSRVREAIAAGLEVPGMVLARQAGEVFSVVWPKDHDQDGAV